MWLTHTRVCTWVLLAALASVEGRQKPQGESPARGDGISHYDIDSDIEYMRFTDLEGTTTRAQMQVKCINIKGYLPEPRDEWEERGLAAIAADLHVSPVLGVWKDPLNKWRWDSDGEIVDFFNWRLKQADDERKRCVRHIQNHWWDVQCDMTVMYFLCQKGTPKRPALEFCTMPYLRKRFIDLNRHGYNHFSQEGCTNLNAFLPQPKSSKENNYLKSMTSTPFRLGMKYSARYGLWKFMPDGVNVTWFGINGTLKGDQKHRCAVSARGVWKAVDCSSGDGLETVVCEKKSNEYDPGGMGHDLDFAAAKADGKLRPPALLMSVALGLCRLTHYM